MSRPTFWTRLTWWCVLPLGLAVGAVWGACTGAMRGADEMWRAWLEEVTALLREPREDGKALSVEKQRHGWDVEHGVTCVVCPGCAFTFDAGHTTAPGYDRYSCPNCGHGADTANAEHALDSWLHAVMVARKEPKQWAEADAQKTDLVQRLSASLPSRPDTPAENTAGVPPRREETGRD